MRDGNAPATIAAIKTAYGINENITPTFALVIETDDPGASLTLDANPEQPAASELTFPVSDTSLRTLTARPATRRAALRMRSGTIDKILDIIQIQVKAAWC